MHFPRILFSAYLQPGKVYKPRPYRPGNKPVVRFCFGTRVPVIVLCRITFTMHILRYFLGWRVEEGPLCHVFRAFRDQLNFHKKPAQFWVFRIEVWSLSPWQNGVGFPRNHAQRSPQKSWTGRIPTYRPTLSPDLVFSSWIPIYVCKFLHWCILSWRTQGWKQYP